MVVAKRKESMGIGGVEKKVLTVTLSLHWARNSPSTWSLYTELWEDHGSREIIKQRISMPPGSSTEKKIIPVEQPFLSRREGPKHKGSLL